MLQLGPKPHVANQTGSQLLLHDLRIDERQVPREEADTTTEQAVTKRHDAIATERERSDVLCPTEKGRA